MTFNPQSRSFADRSHPVKARVTVHCKYLTRAKILYITTQKTWIQLKAFAEKLAGLCIGHSFLPLQTGMAPIKRKLTIGILWPAAAGIGSSIMLWAWCNSTARAEYCIDFACVIDRVHAAWSIGDFRLSHSGRMGDVVGIGQGSIRDVYLPHVPGLGRGHHCRHAGRVAEGGVHDVPEPTRVVTVHPRSCNWHNSPQLVTAAVTSQGLHFLACTWILYLW